MSRVGVTRDRTRRQRRVPAPHKASLMERYRAALGGALTEAEFWQQLDAWTAECFLPAEVHAWRACGVLTACEASERRARGERPQTSPVCSLEEETAP